MVAEEEERTLRLASLVVLVEPVAAAMAMLHRVVVEVLEHLVQVVAVAVVHIMVDLV